MAPQVPALKDWDMSAGAKKELFRSLFPLQESISCVEKCSKPVICAFHGYCIGAGLDLGSACDIRLASEDAKISLREAAVAFIADVASLQRVPHIVGQGIARELAFTAKFIDAKRAKEVNLINEIFPDKESLLKGAHEMALEIAKNSPLAVQGTKDELNYCRGKSIADGLEYVAARSAMILPSDDMAETMKAFTEKRPPSLQAIEGSMACKAVTPIFSTQMKEADFRGRVCRRSQWVAADQKQQKPPASAGLCHIPSNCYSTRQE
jgi:enoyl-CoA hydratase